MLHPARRDRTSTSADAALPRTAPALPRTAAVLRRAARIAAAAALTAGLGACTDIADELDVDVVDTAPASTVIPDEDPAQTAIALSSALFTSSDGAVVATVGSGADSGSGSGSGSGSDGGSDEGSGGSGSDGDVDAMAALAADVGLPLLVGTDQAVADELERLGATTIITADGTAASALEEAVGSGLDVVEVDPAADDATSALPSVRTEETSASVSLLVDPSDDSAGASRTVATAQVEAAGGTVDEIPGGDPGRSGESVATTKEAAGEDPSAGVLALGETFGPAEDATAWSDELAMVTSAPELPGGGTTLFPGRRMVALYGSPGIPSLGALGEQDVDASIERVQELADDYSALSDVQVVPAFEIIATVASDQAGSDGDYSSEISVDTLREWVDAAQEAGVYVVLDLQPGTTDFLTQAKMYEDLLKEPNVGLALDAEWRLEPGQRHLEQIGSVSVDEVNSTAQWLAELTAENDLPQKAFILHQFRTSMITDRQDLDTSHPELAMVVHADGNGAPDDKLGTWRALQQDLPDGVLMAWKNFYDEDSPTFTPEETYDIEPRPWFVSYQ